jgi:hypothetical protein
MPDLMRVKLLFPNSYFRLHRCYELQELEFANQTFPVQDATYGFNGVVERDSCYACIAPHELMALQLLGVRFEWR